MEGGGRLTPQSRDGQKSPVWIGLKYIDKHVQIWKLNWHDWPILLFLKMVYFHFQDRINTMMHFSGIKGGNNIWKNVKKQSNFPVWLKKTQTSHKSREHIWLL